MRIDITNMKQEEVSNAISRLSMIYRLEIERTAPLEPILQKVWLRCF